MYRIFDRKVTLRPFLGHFHIIKGDKSTNVPGYGLFEYIGEEKIVRKNYRKNAFGEQSTPKTAFFLFLVNNSETSPLRMKIFQIFTLSPISGLIIKIQVRLKISSDAPI